MARRGGAFGRSVGLASSRSALDISHATHTRTQAPRTIRDNKVYSMAIRIKNMGTSAANGLEVAVRGTGVLSVCVMDGSRSWGFTWWGDAWGWRRPAVIAATDPPSLTTPLAQQMTLPSGVLYKSHTSHAKTGATFAVNGQDLTWSNVNLAKRGATATFRLKLNATKCVGE